MAADNGFDLGDKVRRAASGVACTRRADGGHLCLVAFDEGTEARYARLQGDAWLPQPERVRLLAPQDTSAGRGGDGPRGGHKDRGGDEGGKDKRELDAEGAATDGTHYYVTGSHAVKRGDCAANPHSARVVRFSVDAAAGRAAPMGDGAAQGVPAGHAASDRLVGIMRSLPGLKDRVGRCLGTGSPAKRPDLKGARGVDIEGLAVRGGQFHFGFRGPSVDGRVPVLRVEAEPFFDGGDAKPVLTWLQVGAHRGIRDLHAVDGGLLLLVGPDDDDPKDEARWSIAFWDGTAVAEGAPAVPRELAVLDLARVDAAAGGCRDEKVPKAVKPEALAVVGGDAGHYRVLVLSDGLCDGGPLVFAVPR